MIDHAIEALRRGEFILLYDFDDREGETDLAIRSDSITPRHILRMRKDAGGLICTAIHRKTYTGITDNDRALTITKVAEQVQRSMNIGENNFTVEFRSPGHVPLPRAAEGLLLERCGQTELAIALAEMADITPAVTVCEMLDDTTGNALSKDDAMAYAKEHNLVFIEGREILETWRKSQGSLASANSARAISV